MSESSAASFELSIRAATVDATSGGLPLSKLGRHRTDTRAIPPARRTACYRIGEVEVGLRTSLRDVAADFHGLYGMHFVGRALPGAIEVEVDRCWNPRCRGAYRIRTDGEDRFIVRRRRSVLPHVEWAINAAVAASLPRFYQVHAGVVARGGAGLVLPANPQSGKSTLVARLVTRGWDYLSDEFALIDPRTLHLSPYPKAVCIKHGSFSVLEGFGVRLDRYPEYDKGAKGRVRLIHAQDLRPHETPSSVPVRMVVFPRYADRAQPVIRPVSRAFALFQLLNVSFTLSRFRARALDILGEVVRGAACYQLETGGIDAACDAIERLWDEAAPQEAGGGVDAKGETSHAVDSPRETARPGEACEWIHA
ncbi:MAG: hypothetical protein IT449_10025 [Phycisphaerales bacterium]|nr:hypothetical protein [Phycisphaerales bacterium]